MPMSYQDRANLIRNAAIMCHGISHGFVNPQKIKDNPPNAATLHLLEDELKRVFIAIADHEKKECEATTKRLHTPCLIDICGEHPSAGQTCNRCGDGPCTG